MLIFKVVIFASAAERVAARCQAASMTGSRPFACLATPTWLSSKTTIFRVPGPQFITMYKTCRGFGAPTIRSLPCVFSKCATPGGCRHQSLVGAPGPLGDANERPVVLSATHLGWCPRESIIALFLSVPLSALEVNCGLKAMSL